MEPDQCSKLGIIDSELRLDRSLKSADGPGQQRAVRQFKSVRYDAL